MRLHSILPRHVLTTLGLVAAGSLLASQAGVLAQSQEPKPAPPPIAIATPVLQADAGGPETGIAGDSWVGPNFGVEIGWDADTWVVESEQVELGYDGLRLGTPASSVFVEAYKGFLSDPVLCLEDANAEIAGRDFVTEVVPLPDRPMPDTGSSDGARQLFGIVARLNDGTIYRGAEFVECRMLPNGAMMELTWQAPVQAFNDEFPLVNDLFANLVVPGGRPELPPLPAAPPEPDPAM